ncbi:MAG: hypothetical protein PWQ29_211 [Verrucomicrobiota bacterium]|jgi:hypothetical protein|nr:hypothetical protein [Verrucomicrobiota bacterium]MDK2962817.1 hypothetical protein [Verrucomicrobiota bacterium]
MLADGLIFNSVEFWTGENPMDRVAATQHGDELCLLSSSIPCVADRASAGVFQMKTASMPEGFLLSKACKSVIDAPQEKTDRFGRRHFIRPHSGF